MIGRRRRGAGGGLFWLGWWWGRARSPRVSLSSNSKMNVKLISEFLKNKKYWCARKMTFNNELNGLTIESNF